MDSLPLKTFITQVPICLQSLTLSAAIEHFGSYESQSFVLVNERSQPLGLLNLADLLPYLGTLATRSPDPLKPSLNLHQSLTELNFPLIEPIATLSAELSLDQFWSYLQQTSDRQPYSQQRQVNEYALVDRDGTYLGLLDRTRLLKHLIHQNPHLLHNTHALPPYLTSPPSHTPPITHAWQELLECLPIPLMLIASTGQILSQNTAWRTGVRLFPYLDNNKSVAASFLADLPAIQDRHSPTAQARSLAPLNLEQWQFVKIPLPQNFVTLEPTTGLKTFADAACASAFESDKLLALLKAAQLIPDTSLGVETLPQPQPQSINLWLVMATQLTTLQGSVRDLSTKNAELAALNRQKDEFLATISHELKTPLTALLGLSNLLRHDSQQSLSPRQAQYTQLIHQSGRQMMMIVNDLVDLSRLETGQMELLVEPVDIATVCDRAREQVKQSLKYAQPETQPLNIELQIEIQPGLDTLIADELRLRQMLVNLFSNALRLTQLPNSVGLRVTQKGAWVEFTVWDTGVGIQAPQQLQVLDQFQQLDNRLNPHLTSTGLELVLTSRLAKLHGGDLSFVSLEDRGSQFSLLLPRHCCDLQIADKPAPNIVLLVEINPQRIQTLTTALQELGYWCLVARSDAEALEKARRFQPSAILLNLTHAQPSVSQELLQRLKGDPQTQKLRTLVLGRVTEPLTLTLVDDFLSFPIEHQDLAEKLNSSASARFIVEPQEKLLSHLTILYLSPVDLALQGDRDRRKSELDRILTGDLNAIPNHEHRVVEVDDLEQAELLTRIWKPNVLLFNDAGLMNPLEYLQQLIQHPSLTALPIVTLTQEITQAANQIPGLCVFPCLVSPGSQSISSTLIQVMQVAAEFGKREHNK